MFSEGEENSWAAVGCACLFFRNRLEPKISRQSDFLASKSSLAVVLQIEFAFSSHFLIGSTHALFASVSLLDCSSNDFLTVTLTKILNEMFTYKRKLN